MKRLCQILIKSSWCCASESNGRGNASAFSYTNATRVCNCQSMQIGLAELDLWVTGWVWNVHCSWHASERALVLGSEALYASSVHCPAPVRTEAKRSSVLMPRLLSLEDKAPWCDCVDWLDKSWVFLSAVSLYLAIRGIGLMQWHVLPL